MNCSIVIRSRSVARVLAWGTAVAFTAFLLSGYRHKAYSKTLWLDPALTRPGDELSRNERSGSHYRRVGHIYYEGLSDGLIRNTLSVTFFFTRILIVLTQSG